MTHSSEDSESLVPVDHSDAASSPKVREPVDFFSWLYNHNPFYVISTVLMLFAVRSSYSNIEIGSINCWVMMGILTTYTIGLSLISILIVRWGKVWEDARSILLLLLLLFLGVSVSADDLFVKMESSAGGALLMLGGFLGSALLTEFTLRGVGLKMGWLYRVPLHLFLAFFYATPWWLSPELHPRTAAELNWILFTFPLIGGALLLTLIPAVRRGPSYINNNGSPWRWPLYPWTAFGMITIALALRTFAVCMTFGQSGPIWIEMSKGQRVIAFDTMWGLYFLVPIAFAVLVLMLEASLMTRNKKLTQRILLCLPVLVLMAFPYSQGTVFRSFYYQVTNTIASPVWIVLLVVLSAYVLTWFRGVREALTGVAVSLVSLSVIGPRTIGVDTLTDPQLIPITALGLLLFVVGLVREESWLVFSGTATCVLALGLRLEETSLDPWKKTVSYALLWGSTVLIGFAYQDAFAKCLRSIGAAILPLVGLTATATPDAMEIPWLYRVLFVFGVAVIAFVIANIAKHRWYLFASFGLIGLCGYEIAALGFHAAKDSLGAGTLTALLWSGGTLLIGLLISSHKARWLPNRIIPNWSKE